MSSPWFSLINRIEYISNHIIDRKTVRNISIINQSDNTVVSVDGDRAGIGSDDSRVKYIVNEYIPVTGGCGSGNDDGNSDRVRSRNGVLEGNEAGPRGSYEILIGGKIDSQAHWVGFPQRVESFGPP